MKSIRGYLILVLFVVSFGAFAQNSIAYMDTTFQDQKQLNLTPTFNPNNSIPNYSLAEKKPNKLKMNASLGTSVTSDFAGGIGVSSFVSPSFTYSLNSKWKLHFGASFNHLYLDNIGYNPYNGFNPYNGSTMISTLYAGGSYLVNEKLAISGTLYKSINMAGPAFSPHREINPRALDLDSYGGNIQVSYKVSDNMTIDANVSINSSHGNMFYPGINPYGMNAFGMNGFGGGFGNNGGFRSASPFSPRFP